MLTKEYCITMARYNAWQNRGLRKILQEMPRAELTKDRGAFFGSIFATVNHLLWADTMWMSRFEGKPSPGGTTEESKTFQPTAAAWSGERFRMDGHILIWAEKVRALDLVSDLSWHSGLLGREVSKNMGDCVMHFFNHQTHHRGQVHAMLTQIGITPEPTDLFLMPESGPWL
ncbi:MAG: DinB family protein [Donghicola eburneus]|jgi:uncharacterized damage-inducible protein DinB|nr:DinB family protein [Donghicola eburneus]MCI5040417.1 DinB family protein [Donghicola eburneus]